MPSRNKVPNAAELVSRSLNWTSGVSPCDRSDISERLTPLFTAGLKKPDIYDEQIIARAGARVQQQAHLWFPAPSAKLK
jgi:hypothetical protein